MVASASSSPKARLAVLLSGRGSNAQALWQAQREGRLSKGHIVRVVSNRSQAEGLAWARGVGLPCKAFLPKHYGGREACDEAIAAYLQQGRVDWVLLAGYNRIITAPLLQAFPGRILNIHPSLLPKFGGVGMVGRAVHEAVLAAGETESGCTVHHVTAEVDAGAIVAQAKVLVLPEDIPERLAARVLQQEHQLYAQAVEQLL